MSTEQNKTLTLGSLFDGSGGFPLGGLLTGQITPVWSSEIEPGVPVRICPSPVSGTVWMVHGPVCFTKQSES